MDDLDAVLASLEHTETVLRPQVSGAQEPEPQINSQIRAELNAGLDAVLNTELDAELDAELNSALSQLNQSEQHTLDSSLAAELDAELEAVFAPSQFDSLVPGGVVYNLGTKFDDFTTKIILVLDRMYRFIMSKSTLLEYENKKNSYEETKEAMSLLQKHYKELNLDIASVIKEYSQLSNNQKKTIKDKWKTFNDYNVQIRKLYTDIEKEISAYLNTIESTSSEPNDEDLLSETTNKKDQSTFDSMYKEITELIQNFEVQFKKVQEHIPKLKKIMQNPPKNKNEVNELLDISKTLEQEFRSSLIKLEFRWADLSARIERNNISLTQNSTEKAHDLVLKINDIRKRYKDIDFDLSSYGIAIEKFATPEYQQKVEDKRRKFQEEMRKETDDSFEEMEMLYQKANSSGHELNQKIQTAKEYIKTVKKFISSNLQRKDGVQSNDERIQANHFHEELTRQLEIISRKMVEAKSDLDIYESFLKTTENAEKHFQINETIFQGVHDFVLFFIVVEKETETIIQGILKNLYPYCTQQYKTQFQQQRHSNKVLRPLAHPTRRQDPKSFEIYLKRFGQTLVGHVYPPIAAPLWTSTNLHKLLTNQPITSNQPPTKSTKSTTQTQYTQPLQVYNRELAALCARLIHIISVSERVPILAALRFAVEMKHTSPLVAAAILSTPKVALTRNASVEHPNLQAITKHLANESLSRLTRMADAEFMRQRVIVETHETQKKHKRHTNKTNKLHTRDTSDVKHRQNHVHTPSKQKHEEEIHRNEEIQEEETHNENKEQGFKRWFQIPDPRNLFKPAHDLVETFRSGGHGNEQGIEGTEV